MAGFQKFVYFHTDIDLVPLTLFFLPTITQSGGKKVIKKLCALILTALWLVSLDAPALTQCLNCPSQGGVGFNYSGPYAIGSCGMTGLATCFVMSCTSQYEVYPGFCILCTSALSDAYDCAFSSPSMDCN